MHTRVISLISEKRWIGRFSPLMAVASFYLLESLAARLVFWGFFGKDNGVSLWHLPAILALGWINDLVAMVYLSFPAVLYLALLPARRFSSKVNRGLLAIMVFAAVFGMIYLSAAEYFFFEEYSSRFNLVAVDYLIYPAEVFENIWDTYPVVWYLLGTLLLTGLIMGRMWPRISRTLDGSLALKRRAALIVVHGCLVWAVYTGISADTFAIFPNRVANELSANGISSFCQAFRTNEISYDAHYPIIDSARAFAVMRDHFKDRSGTFTSPNPDSLERSIPAKPNGLGKVNVVVVVEESFGSEFVGALGDNRGLTPNFDRLSAQGLLFTRVYAAGTRTVRGLEAISLSLPPIPSESVVKRPGNENMTGWGKIMAQNGYTNSFIYGGYGYFDNMNYFFEHNGFAISDRNAIAQPKFANVWGVSDEDLFRHALGYIDQQAAAGKPFFSIIMSTSNHPPFTFPPGVPGVPAEGGEREAGVRYADYALGRFMEESRGHAWFDNTLFVIVADHGARLYGQAQIPIKSYEIPLLLYAPGKIAADRFESVMSQIDLAPTVLGLLGLPYRASFYGHDVLSPGAGPSTIVFNHNHNVAVLRDNQLCILGLGRKVSGFTYDAATDQQVASDIAPQTAELAIAYYQTAYELFKRRQY